MSTALLKVITPGTKVATALERHGPVLSLCIHRHRIEMGVASSNYQYNEDMERIPSIPTPERIISKECIETLREVVRENNVCGFVVAWPLQGDTGKMGASCGRVLFTLESILEATSNGIFSTRRPACLWHPSRGQFPPEEDEWGRCPLHARTTEKTVYRASVERYNEDEIMDVASLWSSFAKEHWPHLVGRAKPTSSSCTNRASSACNLISDCRDSPSTMLAAARA